MMLFATIVIFAAIAGLIVLMLSCQYVRIRGEMQQPKVKTAAKKNRRSHAEEEALPSPRQAMKAQRQEGWLAPAQYAVVQVAKTVVEKGSTSLNETSYRRNRPQLAVVTHQLPNPRIANSRVASLGTSEHACSPIPQEGELESPPSSIDSQRHSPALIRARVVDIEQCPSPVTPWSPSNISNARQVTPVAATAVEHTDNMDSIV